MKLRDYIGIVLMVLVMGCNTPPPVGHPLSDLTRGDLDYCCLYLLGLSDADVAALMQKAYPTVSQRARKMKGIFGSEEPISVVLRSFANESTSV